MYAYNYFHLLLPYGSCVAVSLIRGVLAIFAIHRNGDEFLDFARILEAIPSQRLASSILTGEDCLRVDEGNGLFKVVDTTWSMSYATWNALAWGGIDLLLKVSLFDCSETSLDSIPCLSGK